MKIAFHGGKCCGIKTIHGLAYDPTNTLPSLKKKASLSNDVQGMNTSSATNFFTDAAPQETYVERLDRYIAFLDKRRPKGIIEVVLADYCEMPESNIWFNQIPKWEPLLLERGFKRLNECRNSNSGNKVYVYHRNSGEVNVSVEKQVPGETATTAA